VETEFAHAKSASNSGFSSARRRFARSSGGGEILELLLPDEQFIAVFQPGQRRRTLPLLGRQGVQRLIKFPSGVRPAANHPDVFRQLVVALVAVRVEIAGKPSKNFSACSAFRSGWYS